MDKMTVNVKVHPSIREFVLCTNGTDILVPEPDSLMWQLLKQHLKTVPAEMVPEPEDLNYLRIALRKCNHSKVYTRKMTGKNAGTFCNVTINTLYRSYLDEIGQKAISKHLRKSFKECFHNFMQGAIFENPNIAQKQAIINFCRIYEVSFNNISYEMLVKSWQRSPQKQYLDKQKGHNPLVF